ncbi:unnamed protein product [Ophioblennius macclurei]
MWNWDKVLLSTICLTALFYDVADGKARLLDSASNVVDDMYRGCRQQAMEKFISSGLLEKELNNSVGFHEAWTESNKCSALIPKGIKAHTLALSVLLSEDSDFLNVFHNEVETMGVNVSTYENNFHFKSLHFLLMDAMTLLNPKKCQTMFFLQEKSSVPEIGSIVRFGSFTSGTTNFQELKTLVDFDGLVLFNVTSCFLISMWEHTCTKDKDAVLLSPAEDFIVQEVNKKEDDNEAEYTEIVLKSSQVNSTHNCFLFSRSPAAASFPWLTSALLILSFLCSPI